MNIATLIPTPDAIPVHWGWLRFFQIVTFFIHLLFMNIVLGSSLIALLEVCGNHRGKGTGVRDFERDIFQKLPFVIAFAVNAGVAPLLFLQVLYGNLIYPSSILMGVYWLSVIGVLIVAYYSAYLMKYKFDALGRFSHFLIGLIPLLFLYIAFVFVNNMTLMQRPSAWIAYFTNAGGTLLNLRDPILWPRFVHFVTASVAVAGLFMAAVRSTGKPTGEAGAAGHVDRGMRYYILATGTQMIVGVWFLVKLPTPVRGLIMGGDPYFAGLLLVGICGGLGGIYLALKRRVWPTIWLTLVVTAAMVLLRDLIRAAYLQPYHEMKVIPVQPQYGPMIVFIVSLISGAAVIGYMLRLAFRSKEERMDPAP